MNLISPYGAYDMGEKWPEISSAKAVWSSSGPGANKNVNFAKDKCTY